MVDMDQRSHRASGRTSAAPPAAVGGFPAGGGGASADGGPVERTYRPAMTTQSPFQVLIAGGGPAALEAVLTLRDVAPGVEVTVLAPEADHVYRPLSVLEPFARAKVRRYPLDRLADLGVTVNHDGLMRVDPDRRIVVTDHGQELAYDALLVATGAQHLRAVPRALTFEGPDYVEAMHGLVEDVEGG